MHSYTTVLASNKYFFKEKLNTPSDNLITYKSINFCDMDLNNQIKLLKLHNSLREIFHF